tara:strand:- start:10113 stop:10358 length:246 start_codon:yes stop_codon:yes gene_type:complete
MRLLTLLFLLSILSGCIFPEEKDSLQELLNRVKKTHSATSGKSVTCIDDKSSKGQFCIEYFKNKDNRKQEYDHKIVEFINE